MLKLKKMKNELLQINWIDGMKINKSHFIHNDNLLNFHLMQRTALLLKSYEYGLLPVHSSILTKPLIQLEDSRLIINYCHAVNRRGDVIRVNKEDDLEFDLSTLDKGLVKNDVKLVVVLSKDSNEIVQYGEPLKGELPPRQPFIKPKINVFLVDEQDINSEDFVLNYICLARLESSNGQFSIDDSYIPPCNQINSHQGLVDRYKSIENSVSEIGINATKVVQNAKSKKRRGEINDLADNTYHLMEKIVFHLSQSMSRLRNLYREESPIFLVSFLNDFGRIILAGFDCLRSEDKEALLRYYESHLGLKPHSFETDLKELVHLRHQHIHIDGTFQIIEKHIAMLKTFVSKATQLEFHSVERVDVVTESTVGRSKLDIF